jgi:hypothetical protein
MTPTDQTPARVIVLATTPIYSAVIVALVAASGLVTLRPCDETGAASGPEFFVRVTPGSTPSDADITAAITVGKEVVTGDCRIDLDFVPPTVALRQETRTVLDRLTPTELSALITSDNVGVRALVLKATAAGAIRSDDPEFPAAKTGLDALGIIAASRWDALLAP